MPSRLFFRLLTAVQFLLILSCITTCAHDMDQPRNTIDRVIEHHQDRIMALRGVTGIGMGRCGDAPCIRIFITEDSPEVRETLPAELDGYPVEVVVSGEIKPL